MAGSLIGLAGAGISAYSASQSASASGDIAALQMQILEQQKLQMKLEHQRRKNETLRSMQRARAISLSTAVSQGAQMGTALMGAYGQVSGQGNNQLRALNQNLEIGKNIFNLNQQISEKKMDIADYQGMAAIGQGVSAFGGFVSGALNKSPGVFAGGGGAAASSTSYASPYGGNFGMNPWFSQVQQFNPGITYDPRPYG